MTTTTTAQDAAARAEKLGPAEHILQSMLPYVDHAVHNRPGVITPDPTSAVGVKWTFAKYHTEGEGAAAQKVVDLFSKSGKKDVRTRLGVLQADGTTVMNGGVKVGEYRRPGFFTEVVTWLYAKVAEVWKLDNEFAARWASHAFGQEHADLQVVLAAFMLVQSRAGDPVMSDAATVAVTNNDGAIVGMRKQLLFFDDDFREVGEAMLLFFEEGGKKNIFNPKLLHRVRALLCLPSIAKINFELGFGRSARSPNLGRWEKVVQRYLSFREKNPKILKGLVRSGFRQTVISLAAQSSFIPETPEFYRILRWKQNQAKDGRRKVALDQKIAAVEAWDGLTEAQVCERIMKERPRWNRLAVMIPRSTGLTRAIMAAAIDSGAVSAAEMVILAPTIEELGLFQVQEYKARFDAALAQAENMRAANIALRMKSTEGAEKMVTAAEVVLQKEVAEAMKGMFAYVLVDISGSMQMSIAAAKEYLPKFLPGFPPEKIAIAAFNGNARIVDVKHPSKAGVENAFRGIAASGTTDHAEGVSSVTRYRRPAPDDDVIMIFIGDGGESDVTRFAASVVKSGTSPVAFGFLKLPGENLGAIDRCAAALGIPVFHIDERIFGQVSTGGAADPYAIPRAIRRLIQAAPVGATIGNVAKSRVTLVDAILKTELLKRPAWAAASIAPATSTKKKQRRSEQPQRHRDAEVGGI